VSKKDAGDDMGTNPGVNNAKISSNIFPVKYIVQRLDSIKSYREKKVIFHNIRRRCQKNLVKFLSISKCDLDGKRFFFGANVSNIIKLIYSSCFRYPIFILNIKTINF